MHMSPETIQTGVLIAIFSVAFFILIRLNEILNMYSKSQLNEPMAMKAYKDIDDIRLRLEYAISGYMKELLEREEEKKSQLERLILAVERLYVDKK